MTKTSLVRAALAALVSSTLACGGGGTPAEVAPPEPAAEASPEPSTAPAATGDLVDVAAGNPDFSTLVAAVKAAGLVDTLKGPGPFTVFAPTNAAFAKLPPGTVEGLLADKAALTKVLTFHVVSGRVTAADVAGMTSATTVQGGTLSIDASAGVKVNGASVVAADVPASNGVIHAIDTVLMPAP